MGEILGTLLIAAALVAYAACARSLGRELREIVERCRGERSAREQIEGNDAELIARRVAPVPVRLMHHRGVRVLL